MRIWIKHWLHSWYGAELTMIRRLPSGDSILVSYIDLLCLAAADVCDGELWLSPGIPHTVETLSAVLHRDVIWLRDILRSLEGVGLLTWESGVLRISRWRSEQEPLPQIRARRLRQAENSRRYRERRRLGFKIPEN